MFPPQSKATPAGEFQAQFGVPPGSQDARTDCANWERLCAKLIEERTRLQLELAKAQAQNEVSAKAIHDFVSEGLKFNLTMEEVYAQVDRQTSLEQLIAEFEHEAQNS